jgi:hypothetical protein
MMRIKLELDEFRFATTSGEFGTQRWLLVRVGGKDFYMQRSYEGWMPRNKDRDDAIDRMLIEKMQVYLEAMLLHGAAQMQEGKEIELTCKTGFNWPTHYDHKCLCWKTGPATL